MEVVKDITFEVTLKCNLNCAMCSRQFLKDKSSELSFDLAQEVVDDLAANCEEPVNLSIGGYGEPLLYPHLGRLISLIKMKLPESRITLTSNAHLLNAERGKMLLDSGLDYLRLSLNATCPEEYARLMRSNHFHQVEENIAAFLRLRGSNGNHIKVGLQILDTKINKQRFPEYKKRWLPLFRGEDFIAYRMMENRGGVIDSSGLSGNVSSGLNNKRYPCYALWRYVALDTTGDVYCCCEAYTFREKPTMLRLGSLTENSISSLMKGQNLQQVREMHLDGDYSRLPECRGCNKPINYPNLWEWQGDRWVEKQ